MKYYYIYNGNAEIKKAHIVASGNEDANEWATDMGFVRVSLMRFILYKWGGLTPHRVEWLRHRVSSTLATIKSIRQWWSY